MNKLEVSQWQFDELESIVRLNPGGQEWLEASLVLRPYDDNIMDVEEILYVFFGPLAEMLKWKRREEGNFGEYDYVILATQGRNKIEGRRAKTKRVYGLDGDKTWYWEHFYDPMVKETLEAMYMLESRYGQAK